MRKFAIFLALIMLFTMCSCSQKNEKKNSTVFEDEYSELEQENTDNVTGSVGQKDNSTSTSSENKPSGGSGVDLPTVEDDRIIVACWGDSLTEGMGMHEKSYPTRLSEMLGTDYRVLNGGDGGETTATIAARQGGLKVYTSKDIVFGRNVKAAFVSKETQFNFVTKDGKQVNLTSYLGNGISVNDVTINGNKYKLEFDKFEWEPRSFELYLMRSGDISSQVTIPKGSEVIFNGTDVAKKGGIDIYLMGANGGYSDNAEYISQLKSMIAYHGNDKYIVIKPYWGNYTGLEEAFGKHLLDFKKLAQENGIAYEKLTPTEEDNKAISKNQVPASLHYNNDVSNIHLNQYGYHFLAHCVYEKGKALGYFK